MRASNMLGMYHQIRLLGYGSWTQVDMMQMYRFFALGPQFFCT
jgi:hypothetical protein